MKTRVAFIGWRGMVGSVLLDRMRTCGDFARLQPVFFSTSNPGGAAPDVGVDTPNLGDAHDLDVLGQYPVIVTCQGGGYTDAVHDRLRASGWGGYWIDAASALRMRDEAALVLHPVNGKRVAEAIAGDTRDLIGANCTVSLMLVATAGLFEAGLVEWVSSMTYQAASGAGAASMTELVAQMGYLGGRADLAADALDLDRAVGDALTAPDFPRKHFGHPLAANVLPFIDRPVADGQSREEWKAQVEANKILGTKTPVPIDGTCVRVGALRSHAQGLTIKLTKDVPLADVEAILKEYKRKDREITERAKDILEHRGLAYSDLFRTKRHLAEQQGFGIGDDSIVWMINQMLEVFMQSQWVEEIYCDDATIRRKIRHVLRAHMQADDDLDREVRRHLKHLDENTTSFEIEYEKQLANVKRKHGLE